MVDWNSLPDDWSTHYRSLKLPWSRFLPRGPVPSLQYGHARETRIELLPHGEREFLIHAMDATRLAWSGNWHQIMFLDSGKHLQKRSRSRMFVPVIATIPEGHPFQELEHLSIALGPVLLQTGVFPSVFVITEDLKEIVREAQNPSWLITESLALSWDAHD